MRLCALTRPPVDSPEAHYAKNITQDTEYFIKIKDLKDNQYLSEADNKFLEYVTSEPHSLKEAQRDLKELPISFNISKMEELGLIQRIGLTPTDVMHARGAFTAYDVEASKFGLIYKAKKLGISMEELIDRIDEIIANKIGTEIMKKVIYEDSGMQVERSTGERDFGQLNL